MQIWNEQLGCFEDLDAKVSYTVTSDFGKLDGFYRSEGEFGIKTLARDSFALIYIPKGALVHVEGRYIDEPTKFRRVCSNHCLRKRSTIALVLSIGKLDIIRDFAGTETIQVFDVPTGLSINDPLFLYRAAGIVTPREAFDCRDETCSSGIHHYSKIASDTSDENSMFSYMNVDRKFIQHWADNLIEKYYTKEKCEKMFKEKLQHEEE